MQSRDTDVRAAGKVGDCDRFARMFRCPPGYRSERLVDGGYWVSDELLLPAVSVRAENEASADGVGDLGTVIAPNHVQPEVEGGSASRCGEDVAVIDIQNVFLEQDGREPGPKIIRPLPVRSGTATVEYACLGEGESTAAEPDQPRTAGVCAAHGVEHLAATRHLDVGTVRHNQRVGFLGGVEIGNTGQSVEAVTHERRRVRGAKAKIIEPLADFGAFEPEYFACTAQFEWVRVVVDDYHNLV